MKQLRIKTKGQPAPRWPSFMSAAMARIAVETLANGGKGKKGKQERGKEFETRIAEEICKAGEAENFLKSVRRGRPTARQNLRYRLLREVEALAGAAVPRRREDANTPEAAKSAKVVNLLDDVREQKPKRKPANPPKKKPRFPDALEPFQFFEIAATPATGKGSG